MKSGLTVRWDSTPSLFAALKNLGKRDVLVGIPAEKAARDAVPFGNAAIGYLNEKGSPAQNIPARPHLQPGVKSAQRQIVPALKAAALAELAGDHPEVDVALHTAGMLAVNGVKGYMQKAGFTPLANSTVAARARRGRKGAQRELKRRAAGEEPDNANARPLIDTGSYRNAITYVVREKNANS